MREETLPSLRQIHEALESASVDLYGFAVICQGGAVLIAEPVILDCLLLGLENFWFTHDESGRLSHAEFREEFFRHIWMKAKERAASSPARVSSELPLGHEAMVFYQLPQMARAALYLRTKKRFS